MKEACETEVKQLHQFFQDWFNGALPQSAEAFSRCVDVLQEGFLLVSPQGTAITLDPLLAQLWEMHGSRAESDRFRIWARPVRFVSLTADLGVMMYEEWQSNAGSTTARLSSAVFGRKQGAPCGVEWLHLHETWLPPERLQEYEAGN